MNEVFQRGVEIAQEAASHWQVWIAIPILGMAFTKEVRMLIGKRDKWHCQEEGCDKSFQTGWLVDAAHYNHDKSSAVYNDASNGRILCLEHHAEDHEERGEFWAVQLILDRIARTGGRHE